MNICPHCKQGYDFSYRVTYEQVNGQTVTHCSHDSGHFGTYNDLLATTRVGKRVRQDRIKHAKDILQPYKKDGSVNEHFKKVYGDPKKNFGDIRKKGTNYG
jgi:hypothetical protein